MIGMRSFLVLCLACVVLSGLSTVALAGLAMSEHEAVNPNPQPNNMHGCSVALDGDYVAVGSSYQLDDVNPGTVEVYLSNSYGLLTHQQTLTGYSGSEDFGVDVSLSGDTLVVGANKASKAYVYTRSGSTWSHQQTLSGTAGRDFGVSVSVSGDNLLVGQFRDGKAYAYHRDAGTWSLESTIDKPNRFGYGVGISGDVAIGGTYNDPTNGTLSGSVNIFRRTDTGGGTYAWLDDSPTIYASDAAANAWFGHRTDVYADSTLGDVAIVSAKFDDEMAHDAGAAYIFRYDIGTQTWSEQVKLVAGDYAADDQFGTDVAIFGNTAIVGARYDDDNGSSSGSAYIFQWDGVTYDGLGKEVWLQVDKLTASDGATIEQFGDGVAVFEDMFGVGAPGYSSGGASNIIGSAYVFAPVPEPSSMVLLALAMFALLGYRLRLRRRL